jgi:nucleoside-diphosphate kinase
MKMMTLSDEILREHYAHLADKPFFPLIVKSMQASPVVVMCLKGLEAVDVVRKMTGATRGRHAELGTIRGDFAVDVNANVIHGSDCLENAEIEIKRFFG